MSRSKKLAEESSKTIQNLSITDALVITEILVFGMVGIINGLIYIGDQLSNINYNLSGIIRRNY